MYITIRKDDRTPYTGQNVATDFMPVKRTDYRIMDFHVGGGYGKSSFELNEKIMQALLVITRYYDLYSVIINSTRRTVQYNNLIKGAGKSRHIYGDAIDFSFRQTFDRRNLHKQFKKDIESRGELYQELFALGVREFLFYTTWNHIAIENSTTALVRDDSKFVESKISNTTENLLSKTASNAPVKEYYEYYHQDSSVTTINTLLQYDNSIVKSSSISQEQLLKFCPPAGKNNLERLWLSYSPNQKIKFSTEYSDLTQQLIEAEDSEVAGIKLRRDNVRPIYSSGVDYEINVGTILLIPKNKANIETLSAIGKDLFMVQQDLKAFQWDEFKALMNDPSYVRVESLKIRSNSYSINYLNISFSCWIYIRALGKILNISPFVRSMDTSVAEMGTFSISLMDIQSLESIRKYAETYYSYIQKTVDNKLTTSFFTKFIQQNDVVFIRFERLDIEGKSDECGIADLFISESKLAGSVFDMIGLVDLSNESYNASNNLGIFNFSGRDLNKMILEDGCYFFPFAMQNGGKEFFLNYNPSDSVFKRMFSGGQFLTLFTSLYRDIRSSVGFIFNQLTNTGILPKNSGLLDSYKDSYDRYLGVRRDRQSKAYEVSGSDEQYVKEVEVNGMWKIIKVVVDHQLDERRMNNGELSSPEGSISDLLHKICQDPFVELWGDTMGDMFVFMMRQPPFTKSQIQDYFSDNEFITITADQVSSVNFIWEDTYYTWYQLQPLSGLFGSDQFVAGTAMPIVYFEEYANLFGMHKKVVSDPYISFGVLSGEQEKSNVDLFRKALANDLKFVIESNSVLPFTRKGTIEILGGDRRIKKGMWVYFEPTEEIFYVKSVSNSVAVVGDSIARSTSLSVERGMKRKYSIDEPTEEINGTEINYFNIVNIDVITDNLKMKLAGDNLEPTGSSSNQKLVNSDLFDFFSKRKQW